MSRSFIRGEITGADIQGTLQKLTEADVTLYDTQFQDDLTALITCEPGDFRKVQSICGKRGDRVIILRRQGWYWNLRAIMGRPVLVAGFALILFLSLFLPSRVLFVEVEGCDHTPQRKILETASNCGIRFGASRRSVRSEKMKNALLEAMPELQWAGVNTKGCTAVITVRERTTLSQSGEVRELSHIVALTDARITSCTATRGTLLCTPGQAVVAGQILISGFTDTGLTIRADRAEGEVYGRPDHTGRPGGGGGLRPDNAEFPGDNAVPMAFSCENRNANEKNQPSSRKKTHKFMERQWNLGCHL